MKKIIFSLFLVGSIGLANAQSIDFTKENFKERKSELKDAVKDIEIGDQFLFDPMGAKYSNALPFYEKANVFNPNNAELNYKIGMCYVNGNMKFKSLEYFQKAYKLKSTVDPEIHYYIGRGHQLIQEWDKAIESYEFHKKNIAPGKEQAERIKIADKRIQECKSGKALQENQVRVWIDNMGSAVNSRFPEYGMIMNADATEIYFTSRRDNSTGGLMDEYSEGYFEDIYSSKLVNGQWTPAVNLGDPINTKGHDATVALNSDGTKMLIYLDDKGDGNIYESVRKQDKWSKPKKLNSEICSEYHESSAWYSSDNQRLYFVSNRPLEKKGGPKDQDIYVATWNKEKSKWDNVTRLPETINTPYNEEGIFLHPDGKTLYFSSQGHNSMGGYDIFYSVLQEDGSWTKPVNIGAPINTPDDDVFFVVAASGKTGYLTSFRADGLGEKDLYKITFLGEEKKPVFNSEDVLLASSGVPTSAKVIEQKVEVKRSEMSLLKGTIVDAKTNKPILASIELIDNQKNTIIAEFESDETTGKYMVSLPAGKNYGIAVKSEGYLFHSENFDIPRENNYQEFVKNVAMKKVEVGEVIVLRNIFFDLNKFSLRPESQNELDRLIKLMTDNPTLRIQIGGHTDSRGSAALNKELSENRAKAVVDYLVSKGIAKNRLEFAGYGKEKPIVTDAEIAKLKFEKAKEEAHQSNRRTEFKIVSK